MHTPPHSHGSRCSSLAPRRPARRAWLATAVMAAALGVVAAPATADVLSKPDAWHLPPSISADIAERYAPTREGAQLQRALRAEKWIRRASLARWRAELMKIGAPLPAYASDASNYSANLARAFKLRVEHLIAPGRFALVSDFFRPYLLGAAQRYTLAENGTYGYAIPDGPHSSVLTIGGGGDFHLHDRLVLHIDAASIMHSGPLQGEDHHRVGGGLMLAF